MLTLVYIASRLDGGWFKCYASLPVHVFPVQKSQQNNGIAVKFVYQPVWLDIDCALASQVIAERFSYVGILNNLVYLLVQLVQNASVKPLYVGVE